MIKTYLDLEAHPLLKGNGNQIQVFDKDTDSSGFRFITILYCIHYAL